MDKFKVKINIGPLQVIEGYSTTPIRLLLSKINTCNITTTKRL